MKKIIRKNNAITLLALVITIVILLILTGVTIVTLTGDNGLLSKAKEAKDITDKSKEQELIDMAVLASKVEKYPDIDYDILNSSIKSSFGEEAIVDIVDNEDTGEVEYIIRLPNGNVYPIGTNKGIIDIFVPENDQSGSYAVKFKGYKLSVSSKPGLRIYFTMPEEKINSGTETIKYTVGTNSQQTININQSTIYRETINEELYYYIVPKVSVWEMSQNINYCAYNNNTQDSKEYNYSIKQYGNEILSNENLYGTAKKQEAVSFIKALLNYGGKVQIFSNKFTDNLANEGIEVDDSYITQDYLQEYAAIKEGERYRY